MAEEVKQDQKCCSKNAFGTFFKVILGLAFLALGGWATYHWLPKLIMVIKGCIGLFLILAGFITLAIAKE